MYYAIVTAAVVMFGFQFFFNGKYEQKNGSDFASSMTFIFGGSLAGLVALLAINKFRIEFTSYTLVWSVVTALNMMACLFCSTKALTRINLSLYSIFSMLGGMVMPFVAGLVFYGEKMTLGKALCFAAITVALCLTFSKGESKKGWIYYIGIFVFNGLSGVLSKAYQESAYEKASEAGYSILSAAVAVVLSGIILIFVRKNLKKPDMSSVFLMTGYGIFNKIANFLLLISLAHLPASTQYPMVTGGVMIVSTVLGCFTDKKPTKKELVSVALSFVGIAALILL